MHKLQHILESSGLVAKARSRTADTQQGEIRGDVLPRWAATRKLAYKARHQSHRRQMKQKKQKQSAP
jgi:hypothetical protein